MYFIICGFKIHIVVSGAAQADDPDAAACKDVNDVSVDGVVDKGANPVETVTQWGGLTVEVGFEIGDIESEFFIYFGNVFLS